MSLRRKRGPFRRALISDVHGNPKALQAVFAHIAAEGITEIYCLGDIIGYGPEPNLALDLVRDNCVVVLRGNHDEGARDLTTAADFNPDAYRATEWTREQLLRYGSRDPFAYIESLSSSHHDGDVSYYHASPRNPLYEYIFPLDAMSDKKIRRIMNRVNRLAFVGHTHCPGIFVPDPLGFEFIPDEIVPADFEIPAGPVVVNVGSVGQPRDKDPRACWVKFEGDHSTLRITYYRVDYQPQSVADQIYSIPELADHLGRRLLTGE